MSISVILKLTFDFKLVLRKKFYAVGVIFGVENCNFLQFLSFFYVVTMVFTSYKNNKNLILHSFHSFITIANVMQFIEIYTCIYLFSIFNLVCVPL